MNSFHRLRLRKTTQAPTRVHSRKLPCFASKCESARILPLFSRKSNHLNNSLLAFRSSWSSNRSSTNSSSLTRPQNILHSKQMALFCKSSPGYQFTFFKPTNISQKFCSAVHTRSLKRPNFVIYQTPHSLLPPKEHCDGLRHLRSELPFFENVFVNKKKKFPEIPRRWMCKPSGVDNNTTPSKEADTPGATDINFHNKILFHPALKPLHPYFLLSRWDRPIGTWLLFFPCAWSLTLTTPPSQSSTLPSLFALFLIGSFLLRGAGCTLNDLWDRNLDAHVARTRSRPLPSGLVTPQNALIWAISQIGFGALVLLGISVWECVVLSVSSLILVVAYPGLKRVTWWPQLGLGLTFNWGVLVGFTAASGGLYPVAHAAPMLMYGAAVAWTLFYDTIYAFADVQDDQKVGIKSTARLWYNDTYNWRLWTSALLFVAGFTSLGLLDPILRSSLTFWSSIGLVAIFVTHSMWVLDKKDSQLCIELFRRNRYVGWVIWAALLVACGHLG